MISYVVSLILECVSITVPMRDSITSPVMISGAGGHCTVQSWYIVSVNSLRGLERFLPVGLRCEFLEHNCWKMIVIIRLPGDTFTLSQICYWKNKHRPNVPSTAVTFCTPAELAIPRMNMKKEKQVSPRNKELKILRGHKMRPLLDPDELSHHLAGN